MKYLLPALLFLTAALGYAHYRSATPGGHCYQSYFSATPPDGYGLRRGLVAESPSSSVYHQALAEHRAGRYDYALMGWRAYLETEPLPRDFRPQLLAATAALASGDYTAAREFLADMPRETDVARAHYHWYAALLELREERITAARRHLAAIVPAGVSGRWWRSVEKLDRTLAAL